MSTERTLYVFAIGLSLMLATCLILYLTRAPNLFYYLIVPPIMFASGYAFAWAYGVTNQDVMLVIAAACGLLGVQGAWVLTTRIPRR
jgi:hypothetical protein